MSDLMKSKLIEVLRSVVSLITVVLVFQYTLSYVSAELVVQFLIGAVMTIGGLVFFFLGIDIGALPIGRFIGRNFRKLWIA